MIIKSMLIIIKGTQKARCPLWVISLPLEKVIFLVIFSGIITLASLPSFADTGVFITRWNFAKTGSGDTQLSFGTATSGTVNDYSQEVSPSKATCSASFSGTNFNMTGLASDTAICLGIYPSNFQRISINKDADKCRLLDAEQWESNAGACMAAAFYGCNH